MANALVRDAPVMRGLNMGNMEIGDDDAKHRIICSESR